MYKRDTPGGGRNGEHPPAGHPPARGAHPPDREERRASARRYDPRPIHTDAAARTMVGGPTASG